MTSDDTLISPGDKRNKWDTYRYVYDVSIGQLILIKIIKTRYDLVTSNDRSSVRRFYCK